MTRLILSGCVTLVPKNEGSPVSKEGSGAQMPLSINDETCDKEDDPNKRDGSDTSIPPSKDTIVPAPKFESIGGKPNNGASSADESLGIIAAEMGLSPKSISQVDPQVSDVKMSHSIQQNDPSNGVREAVSLHRFHFQYPPQEMNARCPISPPEPNH